MITMFLRINEAEYLSDYKIRFSFNDGKIGIADLRDSLNGPVFEPIRDLNVFSKFILREEFGTIVWPNGADLAPEFLYFQAFKTDPALRQKFLDWGYL